MKHFRQGGILLLALLLLVLSVFSLSRYAPILKAKQELERQNQEARAQLLKLRSDLDSLADRLEGQKVVNQEMRTENDDLRVNIAKLQEDLSITNEQLELLTSSLLVLNRENASIEEDRLILSERLEKILQDNKNILVKIGSVKELQVMIKEIRKQMSENKMLLRERLDEQALAEGNKGFVIKNGETTYPPKVHIEVTPAS